MPQSFITLGPSDFPSLLREIQDPPRQLYAQGLLPKGIPFLSIVGTRKASREGIRIAEEFAEYFAAMNIVVVSGLATGIDTAAHNGSLRRGGITVAVLGTGLDKIYPASNGKLAERIIQNRGAIISEYSSDEPSYKGNFLRRNRIISGLSSAVLVVEAPQRSGSLATARFAAEQGREVFVVPGALRDINYVGSHDLIRDGAVLVTSPAQLAEDMGWKEIEDNDWRVGVSNNLNAEEGLIISLMREAGVPLKVDKIIELAKLEPRIVSISLASLIIKELVIEDTAGYKLK
jgi:DNA processing protein